MHTGVGSPILTFVDFVGSFGKTQPPQPSVVEFVLFCAAANETTIANKQYSIRVIFVFCNKKGYVVEEVSNAVTRVFNYRQYCNYCCLVSVFARSCRCETNRRTDASSILTAMYHDIYACLLQYRPIQY